MISIPRLLMLACLLLFCDLMT